MRRLFGATENPEWEDCELGKTYKTQTEANDKVWDVNRKTEKALDTLEILYVRFEVVSRDLGEVDQVFDEEPQRFAEIAAQQVHDSRMDNHRLF